MDRMRADRVALRSRELFIRHVFLAKTTELREQTLTCRVFLFGRRRDVRPERPNETAIGRKRVHRVAQRSLVAQLVEEPAAQPTCDAREHPCRVALGIRARRTREQQRHRRLCAVARLHARREPARPRRRRQLARWRLLELPECPSGQRSEEHTSELQSLRHLVCRLLLEKKKKKQRNTDRKIVK